MRTPRCRQPIGRVGDSARFDISGILYILYHANADDIIAPRSSPQIFLFTAEVFGCHIAATTRVVEIAHERFRYYCRASLMISTLLSARLLCAVRLPYAFSRLRGVFGGRWAYRHYFLYLLSALLPYIYFR